MTTQAHQEQLLKMLNSVIKSEQAPFSAEMGDLGEVVVLRRGHVRGFWRCAGAKFEWTPAGYNQPSYACGSIDEAVSYTKASILPR